MTQDDPGRHVPSPGDEPGPPTRPKPAWPGAATGRQPAWPEPEAHRDAAAAAAGRARGRARLRVVTLAAGGASLIAAGAVAWNLPGPAHRPASVTTPSSRAPAPPAAVYGGDDGSGDDGSGSRAYVSGQAAPHRGGSTAHVTSGAS